MSEQFDASRPIYAQLVERLKARILAGTYPPGGQKMYLGYYIFFGGLPFHVRQLPKLSPIITDESRTSIKQILYSHSIFLSPMLKKRQSFFLYFYRYFFNHFFIITVYYTFFYPAWYRFNKYKSCHRICIVQTTQNIDISNFFPRFCHYRRFHLHVEYVLHVLQCHGFSL